MAKKKYCKDILIEQESMKGFLKKEKEINSENNEWFYSPCN